MHTGHSTPTPYTGPINFSTWVHFFLLAVLICFQTSTHYFHFLRNILIIIIRCCCCAAFLSTTKGRKCNISIVRYGADVKTQNKIMLKNRSSGRAAVEFISTKQWRFFFSRRLLLLLLPPFTVIFSMRAFLEICSSIHNVNVIRQTV